MGRFRQWTAWGILSSIFVLPSSGLGEIIGVCSNCHTMHNSEQGLPVAYVLDSSYQRVTSQIPFPRLLKTDCVGCHSHTGTDTIVNIGLTKIPIVFNMLEPTYPPNGSAYSTLAGGNFYWTSQLGDQYGHNVYGISGQDWRLGGSVPAPGGDPNIDECATCHRTLATQDTGCFGCHVPIHHAPGTDEVVGSKEGWYRFLGSVMERGVEHAPTPNGVIGIEDPDWEQNPVSTRHNTYQGTSSSYNQHTFLDTGSIDQKCAGCHGLFHSQASSGSAWIRHPVDYAIPDSGEFTGLSLYDPMVPVARQNVTSGDANFSTINRGSDVISCLSCHRAHGSPYPAMMRWAYRAWPGTDPYTGQPAVNGCAICHTSKD